MDGKVQCRVCLKSFQLGTVCTELPLLDFGSAHTPGKKEENSKLRKEAKKEAAKKKKSISLVLTKV